MFKKTIAKAAIGALALSSIATQAVTMKDFTVYTGFQQASKIANPNSNGMNASTEEAAWKDFLPFKGSDFANFSFTFGAVINPALTFGMNTSVEFYLQTYSKAPAEVTPATVAPANSDETMQETKDKLQNAASSIEYTHTTFKGLQFKGHYAIGESLDFVIGVGGGGLSTPTTNFTLAFPFHMGVNYHVTDHFYMPINIQYVGNPFSKTAESMNHWTFNVGAHYHV